MALDSPGHSQAHDVHTSGTDDGHLVSAINSEIFESSVCGAFVIYIALIRIIDSYGHTTVDCHVTAERNGK